MAPSSADRHPAPRIAQSARGREIVEAALTLFADRGYFGASMKDIAALLGMTAPSLYNHLDSKQELLQEIMLTTMATLLAEHQAAVGPTDDVGEQLRRAMEVHVRYHARHQRQARIGNAEIRHLDEPVRSTVLAMRAEYARSWQDIIERGVRLGRFSVASPQLSAYALLQMGVGVSVWYHEDGPMSETQVAYSYADMAIRLVTAGGAAGTVGAPVVSEAAASEAAVAVADGAPRLRRVPTAWEG